jgi:hypothetical protein
MVIFYFINWIVATETTEGGKLFKGGNYSRNTVLIGTKQKSYKCDNQLITWWTGITRPAGSWNLVTLKTNFAQYKNFVWVVHSIIYQYNLFFQKDDFTIRFWFLDMVVYLLTWYIV